MQAIKERNKVELYDITQVHREGKSIYDCLEISEKQLSDALTIIKECCRLPESKAAKAESLLIKIKEQPYITKVLVWLTLN